MTKELFDVCLTGNLLTGHNRREVAVNLAQLVGTSIPQAAALLDHATCVKSRVDESTAAYYHEIIEETGAEAVIRACLAHAESSQPDPVAADRDDEPRFDAVPVVAPRSPQPAPAALAMIRPVAPVAVPTPPVPTPQPSLAPEQPIDIEPTPVLDESMPPSAPALPDQDTTQPFATPLPAPLARRMPRWLKAGGAVGVLLLLVVAGFMWLLPGPVTPGLAIPVVGESLNLAQPFQQQVEHYWRNQGQPPAAPQDLGWTGAQALGELASLTLRAKGVLVITYHDSMAVLAQQTLELQPVRGEQGFEWSCVGGTLSALERPLECRRTVVK